MGLPSRSRAICISHPKRSKRSRIFGCIRTLSRFDRTNKYASARGKERRRITYAIYTKIIVRIIQKFELSCTVTVALRETPTLQCTRILPWEAQAWSIQSQMGFNWSPNPSTPSSRMFWVNFGEWYRVDWPYDLPWRPALWCAPLVLRATKFHVPMNCHSAGSKRFRLFRCLKVVPLLFQRTHQLKLHAWCRGRATCEHWRHDYFQPNQSDEFVVNWLLTDFPGTRTAY